MRLESINTASEAVQRIAQSSFSYQTTANLGCLYSGWSRNVLLPPGESKDPPAKPGAFDCWPLKGAYSQSVKTG